MHFHIRRLGNDCPLVVEQPDAAAKAGRTRRIALDLGVAPRRASGGVSAHADGPDARRNQRGVAIGNRRGAEQLKEGVDDSWMQPKVFDPIGGDRGAEAGDRFAARRPERLDPAEASAEADTACVELREVRRRIAARLAAAEQIRQWMARARARTATPR